MVKRSGARANISSTTRAAAIPLPITTRDSRAVRITVIPQTWERCFVCYLGSGWLSESRNAVAGRASSDKGKVGDSADYWC